MAAFFAPRDGKSQIEEGLHLAPKFDGEGLIPAVVTHHETGMVLMVAYMNEAALRRTIEIQEAVFFSRSRQELWHKGATSGHTLKVVELRTDCDQDCLWLRVLPQGEGACHTGRLTCFYRSVTLGGESQGEMTWVDAELTFDKAQVYGK